MIAAIIAGWSGFVLLLLMAWMRRPGEPPQPERTER